MIPTRWHLATVVLAATVLTGCASGSSAPPPHAPNVNLLLGCGYLSAATIASAVHTSAVTRQSTSEICSWTSDDGRLDITYAWLPNDTLRREADVAGRLGYRIEHKVVQRFGVFTWRDPRDPGTCGVSAFDAGTVTWWVQNRNHSAQPDPCVGALALASALLHLDG